MARSQKEPLPDPDAVGSVRPGRQSVESAAPSITLAELPVGSRLLVRSRTNWRVAAIARFAEETVVLTVSSPTGHSYRLRRPPETEVLIEGQLAILRPEKAEHWKENFSRYDARW